jgi:hypothetical protein
MNRRLLVLTALAAGLGLVAADAAFARGGGGGGGNRGGGGGRSAARRARQSKKDDGKKRDLEAQRERLRQMDYRDRDASRDRGDL